MYPTADKTTDFLRRFGSTLADWRVLELGPYNGRNTRVIAPHCREIVAIDARKDNCELVEAMGLPNVKVVCADVDAGYLSGLGQFDLIFHSGVLYHLRQPQIHIASLPQLSNRLWLNTHYSIRAGGEMRRERVEQPREGVRSESVWLDRRRLFESLKSAGYDRTEVIAECVEPNGPRICIYAEKTC